MEWEKEKQKLSETIIDQLWFVYANCKLEKDSLSCCWGRMCVLLQVWLWLSAAPEWECALDNKLNLNYAEPLINATIKPDSQVSGILKDNSYNVTFSQLFWSNHRCYEDTTDFDSICKVPHCSFWSNSDECTYFYFENLKYLQQFLLKTDISIRNKESSDKLNSLRKMNFNLPKRKLLLTYCILYTTQPRKTHIIITLASFPRVHNARQEDKCQWRTRLNSSLRRKMSAACK